MKLRVLQQFIPGSGGKAGLTVNRLPHGLRTAGTVCPLQPSAIERIGDKVGRVRGNRGFLLFPGGVADTDKEAGQQECDAEHGAARVGRQRTGAVRGEEAEKIGEERLGPHRGVLRRGECVEHDRVGLGERQGGGLCQQRGKVGQVHVPGYGLRAVLEGAVVFVKETLQVRFIARQVAESVAVLERKGKWFEGVVEAQQVDRAGDVAGRPESGERIGGRPEADVPQDKFASVMLEALNQPQLADIQRFGFGDRADHRMKGLVMGQGMDAVRPVGEFDESVSGGGLHGENLGHRAARAKLKLGGRASPRAEISLGICERQGSPSLVPALMAKT